MRGLQRKLSTRKSRTRKASSRTRKIASPNSLPQLHAKEAESEAVRLALLEAEGSPRSRKTSTRTNADPSRGAAIDFTGKICPNSNKPKLKPAPR